MSSQVDRKEDRLQLRLDERSKRAIRLAAAYSHQSLSQFVIETAVARAWVVIDAHDGTRLSEPDWERFHAALVDPPHPNEALQQAFQRHPGRSGQD